MIRTRRPDNHQRRRHQWTVVFALVAVIANLLLGFSVSAQGESTPVAPPSDAVPGAPSAAPGKFKEYGGIEDKDRYFTNAQRSSLSGDVSRLNNEGEIPTLLVVRRSTDTPEQSLVYARATRTERGIESAEGADDGLVLLLTFPPGATLDGYLVYSYGENTFPEGAMNADKLNKITEERVLPQFAEGHFYLGLQAGMREIFYQDYFFADPHEPLDGFRKSLKSALDMVMPVIGIGFIGALAVILSGESKVRRNRTLEGRLFVGAAIFFLLAAILLGIFAKSRLAIGSGIEVGIVLGVYLLSKQRLTSPSKTRRITVRPLGTKKSASGGVPR